MVDHGRRRASFADGVYLVGGGALFASAFMYWVARGPGSGLRGHALVDALIGLGRHVPALSAGRLTVVWYLVPALGAISWIVWAFTGITSWPTRVTAVLSLLVTLVAALAFRHLVGAARVGWGSKVALLGALVMCAGCAQAWWSERRHSARVTALILPESETSYDQARARGL